MSPFAKIDGLYFNNEDEPYSFYYSLLNDLEKKYADKGITYIKCEFDNPKDFYDALQSMENFSEESVSISGTSRSGHYEMIINEDMDMDDTTKPNQKEEEKPEKKKK